MIHRFRPIKFQENFLYGEEIEHCEIPHSSLKLSHNIGKGAFGSVYLAVADGIGPKECSGLVAVKKLKSMRHCFSFFNNRISRI